MPDGATPRLALLKLRQKVSSWRSNGRAGIIVIISGGCGSLGAAGLKAFNVFLSQGPTLPTPEPVSCRRQFTHHDQLLNSGCAPIWTWSPPLPDARGRSLPRDTLSVGDQVQPIASKEFLEPRLQLALNALLKMNGTVFIVCARLSNTMLNSHSSNNSAKLTTRFSTGSSRTASVPGKLCQTVLQQNLAQARTVLDFRSQSVVMIVDLGQIFRCPTLSCL